jgi:cytidine deaminase
MEREPGKRGFGKRSYLRAEELRRIPVGKLSPLEKRAVEAALRVRENAYAPYSNYKVGAAVVSATGKIYTGVNVENCVYSVPHAERNALAEMAKHGERRFTILACVAANGGVPCLSCRQDMREFSGRDLDAVTVIGMGTDEPDRVIRCTFGSLVGVDSFGPEDLLRDEG